MLPDAGKGLKTKRFIQKHEVICYYDGFFFPKAGQNAIDIRLRGDEIYIYVHEKGLLVDNQATEFLFNQPLTHYNHGTPNHNPRHFLVRKSSHTNIYLIPDRYTPGMFTNDAAYCKGVNKYTYQKRNRTLNNAVLVPAFRVDTHGSYSIRNYTLVALKDIQKNEYIYCSYGYQFWKL